MLVILIYWVSLLEMSEKKDVKIDGAIISEYMGAIALLQKDISFPPHPDSSECQTAVESMRICASE